jgi:hypothetical protein
MRNFVVLTSLIALSACSTRTSIGERGSAGRGTAGLGGTAGVGTAGLGGSADDAGIGGASGTGTAGLPGTAGDGTAGSGGATGAAGVQATTTGEAACIAASTSSAAGPITFLVRKLLGSSSSWYPTAIAFGDFDGDKRTDVAVGYDATMSVQNGLSGAAGGAAAGTIVTFTADGDGNLAKTATYAPAGLRVVSSLATGDIDGDGALDLVATDGDVQLFTNTGAKGLLAATPQTYSVGAIAGGASVGDVNGDKRLDVVVGTTNGDRSMSGFAVLQGSAGGMFVGSQYPVGDSVGPIVLGDLDGDGHLDVAMSGISGIHVLMNDGLGAYGPAKTYLAPVAGSLALGDVNGDTHLDLALSAQDGISMLLNIGNGAFAVAKKISDQGGFALGDLDGDGDLDLVASYGDCSAVAILLNDGKGNFAAPFYATIGNAPGNPGNVAIADVTGDGKADIVVLAPNTSYVLVHTAP